MIVVDPLDKTLLKLFKIWEYIAPALALPVPLLPARLLKKMHPSIKAYEEIRYMPPPLYLTILYEKFEDFNVSFVILRLGLWFFTYIPPPYIALL